MFKLSDETFISVSFLSNHYSYGLWQINLVTPYLSWGSLTRKESYSLKGITEAAFILKPFFPNFCTGNHLNENILYVYVRLLIQDHI